MIQRQIEIYELLDLRSNVVRVTQVALAVALGFLLRP